MTRAVLVALLLFVTSSAADEVQHGQFEVTYQLSALLDQETIDSVSDFMDVDADVTWKMYVPDSYDPEKPAGLMVYISPTRKGWMPRSWQEVIDESNLIWIAANESGNEELVAQRMLYAVVGPQIAESRYRIDADRIYLSGFSGGGRVSGMVAVNFANLFRGAIYICGAEFWREEVPRYFANMEQNRYVFLTGSDDFNRDLTYSTYFKYKKAGLENIELINVPRMSHQNPDTRYFRKAIEFLDQRD